jgi:hypothetical protein
LTAGTAFPLVSIWTTGWMLNAPPAAALEPAPLDPAAALEPGALLADPAAGALLAPDAAPDPLPAGAAADDAAGAAALLDPPPVLLAPQAARVKVAATTSTSPLLRIDGRRTCTSESLCSNPAMPGVGESDLPEPNKEHRDLGHPAPPRDQKASAAIWA